MGKKMQSLRQRLTLCTKPSQASRRPQPRPSLEQTRLTATSGTTARKSSSLRLASTKPMTNSPPNEALEEAEKQFKEVESDVSALTRRIMLMEEVDKNLRATIKMASDNEQKLRTVQETWSSGG